MPKPTRLFVSHSSKDRRFVERLVQLFADHKLKFWYSRRHIQGARQWHDEIGKALATCNWFVLVVSPAAVKSKWVKHELLYALQQRSYKGHIVVLIHQRADVKKLSWTLPQFQSVDFTKRFDDGCRALLRAWGMRDTPRP